MKSLASAVLLSCVLPSCSPTSQPSTTPDSTVAIEAAGLQLVVGTWRFSHFDAPTVRDDSLPNPAEEVKQHISGMQIAIEDTGKLSFVGAGHAISYKISVLDKTPLYLKVGAKERPLDEALVYEYSSRLLMMPIKLEINGKTGVLPTYLKRTK